MPVTTLDLVLIGFGNVARRFVRLWDERRAALREDEDVDARVIGIATARHGCVVDAGGIDAIRAADAVEAGRRLDEAARRSAPRDALETIAGCARAAAERPAVVIEMTTLDIERGEPAATHIRCAFAAGMHVVTANKGPIACAWHGLRQDAARRGLHFLFEGTVLDGIPVFNLVRETLPAVRVIGFRGVVNTTTNYALEAMAGGQELAAALAEMHRVGIAEADASLDVEGWDAAAKTAALVNVLMDRDLTPRQVDRTGIGRITAADVHAARERRRRLRLVASASVRNGRLTARVAPEELPETDPLAQLGPFDNAIAFDTDLLGEIVVIERDGGLTQTAYALVTDLVAIGRRLRAPRAAPVRRTP